MCTSVPSSKKLYERYFKSFALLIHSGKNQQMDLKSKKLYSPGYNLRFDITAIPIETFFISIDEFVDACGIPLQFLLFDSPLLRGSTLVLIHPALNLCTHRFTVDFVMTLCVPYTMHILTCFSLPETFSSIKN